MKCRDLVALIAKREPFCNDARVTSTGAFGQLLANELHSLKQTGRPCVFSPGQIIFREGDVGDGLYLVDEGLVEISAKVGQQERRVLAKLGPNSIFGEMAVIDDEVRSATAIAESDTRLTFVGREDVLSVLKQYPDWLTGLLRELTNRVRTVDRRYLDEILQAERLSLIGRFAQGIVHDFKNPLNIIGMAAELAGMDDISPKDRGTAKMQICKQVARLTNMINEVLEFTRGSQAPVALVSTDYGQFVEETLGDLQTETAERSIVIECENPPRGVLAALDRRRLPHVFHNLFNNSMDFMPDGGKIVLRFCVTDDEVTTDVEDSGPGIAQDIVGKLFEPFATFGKAKGTGLGLSICKRIIEDHRGRIAARSEPGRGAIFSFTLPRCK